MKTIAELILICIAGSIVYLFVGFLRSIGEELTDDFHVSDSDIKQFDSAEYAKGLSEGVSCKNDIPKRYCHMLKTCISQIIV